MAAPILCSGGQLDCVESVTCGLTGVGVRTDVMAGVGAVLRGDEHGEEGGE